MRTCDDVQRALSLLADGLLPADERAEVRAHVAGCAACGGVLADLERIRAAARALGPIAPPDHVWLEVVGQMRLSDTRAADGARVARAPRALWQWVGLAAALVIVTSGVYLFQRAGAPETPAATATPSGSVETVAEELNLALQHYDRAIAELEVLATKDSGEIDPATAATVQRNLGLIDDAIAESRTALLANPQSEPARSSLFDALRQKISVLKATVSLINQMRQGDQEAAGRVVEGMGKKS